MLSDIETFCEDPCHCDHSEKFSSSVKDIFRYSPCYMKCTFLWTFSSDWSQRFVICMVVCFKVRVRLHNLTDISPRSYMYLKPYIQILVPPSRWTLNGLHKLHPG